MFLIRFLSFPPLLHHQALALEPCRRQMTTTTVNVRLEFAVL